MDGITTGFRENVNKLATGLPNLEQIREKLTQLVEINNNLDSLVGLSTKANDLVIVKQNLTALNLISASINELLLITTNLTELKTVVSKYTEIKSNHIEIREIGAVLRVELDKFFSRDENIKNIYEDIKLKNIQINQNLLSIQGIGLEVGSSAAVSLAAKNAIDEKYAVYAEVLGFKVELLAIASKINQLSIVETNLDEKYAAYLQVLGIKPQILEIAPRIEELISSSDEINSNIELALNLLFSARENIELLNDYKTYDKTNKLRFEAIETKEITNYTKMLTRLKIIEDST